MIKELENLKNEILEYAKNKGFRAWFYPEYEGVKGFLGTQDIFLVGLNPSSGTFPSKKDKKLYDILKKEGLENIHITDFIKVRAKNKEVPDILKNQELVEEQINFFRREIDILNPKIIIALGLQCKKLLNDNFPKVKIERIKHYGYRYQNQDAVFEEISESLKKIKEIYRTSK